MIKWKKTSVKPPLDRPLLLWYQGGSYPVFGTAHKPGLKAIFSSSQARGVVFTHWAVMNDPNGKRVTYGRVPCYGI